KPSGQYAANSTPTTAKQLTTDHCPLTTAMPLATDSETRAKLTTPTLDSVIVVGSQFLRLNWSPVSDATGYLVQSSTGTSFVNNLVSRTVDAPGTSMTLTGLQPDTTYYVRVQALAGAGNSDSDFSVAKSAKTGIADGDDAASYLQGWLDNLNSEFDRVALLVPQLETTVLDAKERLRLNGSGVRRLGHIKKVLEVSLEFPQFWPAFAGDNNMDEQVREIDVLRNLLIETQYYSRVIGDLLLLADHAAFRSANTYYTTVRDAARRDIPEAKQVFNKLKLFWRRPRRTTDVPTEQEVERDLHALEHGTADGSLYVENESDHVTKGKKTVIDNVVPKQRRAAARFEEQEEIE
ncbi:MAG: fibronectin type III domain-containing protein, partial [Planctomycetaceae bacterium]|nr:fibronectin type III domain-containing protein [Planctomycetaceae bacterium]